jgi:hypothetical protein
LEPAFRALVKRVGDDPADHIRQASGLARSNGQQLENLRLHRRQRLSELLDEVLALVQCMLALMLEEPQDLLKLLNSFLPQSRYVLEERRQQALII